MRLIDAHELIKNKFKNPISYAAFCNLVGRQPTVDAVPVVHGRWKRDTGGYGFWICSHCGFVSEASAAYLLYRYCPHCGARMDGDENEDD